MSLCLFQKSLLVTALIISALLLSGCDATTVKVGVPESYKGKLIKLNVKQKPSLPLVELEVLEIDDKAVENPSSVKFFPGEYLIKSQCKALKGFFTTTKTYYFKHGYQFELEAVEDEKSGTCRTRLMQYKTFAL